MRLLDVSVQELCPAAGWARPESKLYQQRPDVPMPAEFPSAPPPFISSIEKIHQNPWEQTVKGHSFSGSHFQHIILLWTHTTAHEFDSVTLFQRLKGQCHLPAFCVPTAGEGHHPLGSNQRTKECHFLTLVGLSPTRHVPFFPRCVTQCHLYRPIHYGAGQLHS